jgi:membrane protease subunit HflC
MNQNRIVLTVAVALAAVLTALSAVYVVEEREHAVVVRFGEVVRVESEAGLYPKLPFVERAHPVSARLLGLGVEAKSVRMQDGKDVVADVFVKWRVDDVRHFHVSGGEAKVGDQLRTAIVRQLSDELGRHTFKSVAGGEWQQIADALTGAADREARSLGAAVEDVRLQRIGVPANNAVFERMRAERASIAKERRAEGARAADQIRVEAERTRDQLLADGYARAERIRGEGDARVAAIYANAATVAPEFFLFYRSLNAYKESFRDRGDVLVVDPSTDFFKYLKKPTR